MTSPEIVAALAAYMAHVPEAIREMARERGLDDQTLSPDQYKALITEDAEWYDKIAVSTASDAIERESHTKHAQAMRDIAAKI